MALLANSVRLLRKSDNLIQTLSGSGKTRKFFETYFILAIEADSMSSFLQTPSLVSKEKTTFHFLPCLTLSLPLSDLVSH